MRSYALKRRALLATSAMVAVMTFVPGMARAQNATWLLNPVSGDFNTGANWSPTTVPTGTALFGASNTTALTFSAATTIGGWTFNAGASAYTFANNQALEFNGAGIVINGGSASIANAGGTIQFFNTSTAGNVSINNIIGVVQFLNTSTAGNATIANASLLTFFNTSTGGNATITNSVSGSLDFFDTSTAANAAITNNGSMDFNDSSMAGNAVLTNTKMLNFLDTSTAGNANITNSGNLNFNNGSTAGNATITNSFSLNFNDSSSAGNAVITNSSTATMRFNDSSTAGNATVTNNGSLNFNDGSTAGNASITNGDTITFNANSSAGSASIINDDNLNFNSTSTAGNATINNANFGSMTFNNSSTAGNATITSNGSVFFEGTSTAGNATIINRDNVFFSGNSTGGNAAITNTIGASTDFSGSSGPAGDNKLSVGSIAGVGTFVLGANELTVGGNNMSTEVSGVISGILGSLVKVGTGTLTLSGTNAYFGPTTVNAGTLMVDGSIASSILTAVNAGGTLGGNGTVGRTVINTGGVLAPGPGGTPGTMTVAGNLAFQSGAFYAVQVGPTTASTTNVSGTASLAGTVAANFAPGSFLERSYTILTAAGGRSSTFDALATSGLPADFQVSVSYPGNTAVLNLVAELVPEPTPPTPMPPTTPPILTPPAVPPFNFTINQINVGHAIDNFFNNGGALPPAFVNLYGLSGSDLANALSQLSGEPATGAQTAAFQLTDQFLNLMLDPFVDGRGGVGGADQTALGFAPERETTPPEIALAYASVFKAAPVYEPRWTAWGGAFGGSNSTTGDPVVIGSHDLSARTFGFVGGLDYHFAPDTVAGFALAGGGTNWSLAQALGGGRSDAFQAGVYGTKYFGPVYVAGSLAFANNWMTTNRIALADQLTASFNAQSFGGRVETGYRYAMQPAIGVTPYGALQAQSFHTPSYTETDLTGGGFGLSYAAMNATDTRSELGARFDGLTALNGLPLILRGRLAWAHDWVSNPALTAVFQALPGASFVVNGAALPANAALASAGAELKINAHVSLLGKFDGEFASRSQTYAGTGTLRYTW